MIYGLLYVYIAILEKNERGCAKVYISKALLLISITIVSLNAYNIAAGFGFAENVPRYFGITNHPNFMGVQLAIAMISICPYIEYSGLRSYGGLLKYFFLSVSLLCGAFLLYNTGSRTALIFVAVGLFLFVIFTRNVRLIVAGGIFATSLIVYPLVVSNGFTSSLDVYDRGGENTRAEAWSAMYNEIMEFLCLAVGIFHHFQKIHIYGGGLHLEFSSWHQ